MSVCFVFQFRKFSEYRSKGEPAAEGGDKATNSNFHSYFIITAGTSIGLAAGVTGGTGSITERIIKSGQMKEAKKAIQSDQNSTEFLQSQLQELEKNENVKKKIAKELANTGGSAVYDTYNLSRLLGASSLFGTGLQSAAEIFGDDVAKHVSKVILVASGRVVTGTLSIGQISH